MPTGSYVVDEVDVPEGALAECGGGCRWKGLAEDCEEIESCALSAGDPSPCGRCPDCDSLAYLAEPEIELTRYFAFTAGHHIVPIGPHPGICAAMDHEPEDAVWTFSEESLRELRDRIDCALATDGATINRAATVQGMSPS